jgi:multidrug resistance efflux pump
MKIRVAAATLAAASLLAISACDSRDYEAEIAALQSDLQRAKSENEQMQTELDGLRTQAEQSLPDGALENVQTELNKVVQTAATTFEQMGAMTSEPDAPAERSTEALGGLRGDMQTIVQSVQAAAEDLGLELETVTMDTDADAMEGTPEPATGTAEEPAATPEQQPAEGSQEPASKPAQ